MYGIYYLMFTTFPTLFSGIYGFSAGISGLCYIGLGIGFFAATFFGASYADKIYLYVRASTTISLDAVSPVFKLLAVKQKRW